jgi:cobalt/nickel transport protein
MNHQPRNRAVVLSGLSVAILIAVCLSPFASKSPDGLDRIAKDLEFESKANPQPLAKQLPFAAIFDEYALRGVPEHLATPLAGLVGTVSAFGLAWGLGKLSVRGRVADRDHPPSSP